MITVWKFALKVEANQIIKIPCGFTSLSIQLQNGVPTLWALVNTETPTVEKTIKMYGTNHPIEDPTVDYISTVQLPNGLVFHFFMTTKLK